MDSVTQTPFGGSAFMQGLYDALMAKIEPELTSVVLPTLDEKYAGESEGQKAERAERYGRAFATFERQWNLVLDTWKSDIQEYKNGVVSDSKKQSDAKESALLADIASSIDAQ